jgi:hypothetical protein
MTMTKRQVFPADRAPDRPPSAREVGNGINDRWVRDIRRPTDAERDQARAYLRRVAPDLLEMLGLA